MLHEEIKGKLKEAMLAKDALLLKSVRNMLSAFTNELVLKGKKPNEFLTRLAKQRKDSIEQFTNGGRADLAEEEAAELSILEKYLPKMMEKDEVLKFAKTKQTELGLTDVTKKGMLMAALMKDLKGKADGSVVKDVVDSLF
jgi:uncharacterized protein